MYTKAPNPAPPNTSRRMPTQTWPIRSRRPTPIATRTKNGSRKAISTMTKMTPKIRPAPSSRQKGGRRREKKRGHRHEKGEKTGPAAGRPQERRAGRKKNMGPPADAERRAGEPDADDKHAHPQDQLQDAQGPAKQHDDLQYILGGHVRIGIEQTQGQLDIAEQEIRRHGHDRDRQPNDAQYPAKIAEGKAIGLCDRLPNRDLVHRVPPAGTNAR